MMPSSFSEGPRSADFILSEAPGQLSRDNVLIAANQTIKVGQIIVDGGVGGYVAYDKGAPPAAGEKLALSLYAVTTEAATVMASVISRNAEVNGHCIRWPVAVTVEETAIAFALLAAQHVIVRGTPEGTELYPY